MREGRSVEKRKPISVNKLTIKRDRHVFVGPQVNIIIWIIFFDSNTISSCPN